MNKDSKIYVAGHKGLVGSAICTNLKQKGYTNIIGRTHQELDLMDRSAVRAFFVSEKPEYVFLAAAHVGGIMANNTYRADFIYNNLQIQQNIIGESYEHQVKKLLFLGSSCIYPKEVKQPIQENDLLTGPLEYTNEPYAIAKIAGLKMCENFNLQYGTNYIAVMPTNLYGPNDNFDLERSHVLPAIIRKIYLGKCLADNDWESILKDLKKRPLENLTGNSSQTDVSKVLKKYGIFNNHIELWGSGKPLREFLWSEDMADACVYTMEHIHFRDLIENNQEIRNCHINIGSGEEISIAGIAELVKETIEYKGDIKFNPEKPDGTMRKLMDSSKLNRLGWQHKVHIEKGVEKLFQWYIQSLEID